LPTSLTHIVLGTRGWSPWRPDAVMSTAEQGADISKPWFSRAVGGARDASEDEALLPVFLPRLRSTRFGGNRAPGARALFRRAPTRPPLPPSPLPPLPAPAKGRGRAGTGLERGVRAGGLPSVPFLRGETVKKKRELFPGPPPASQGSVALPQASPWPGAGILTRFPFDRRRNAGLTQPPPPTASQ